MRARIHPTAIVHPEAVVGEDVAIGAYAIVGAGVRLGARTILAPHAVVEGPTVLGEGNAVSSFAVLGTPAQARAKADAPSDEALEGTLRIGAGNVFREHVTVHRGTRGHATVVGDGNLFMASSHVAHDAVVGSHGTFANAVQLAGHAVIGDYVTFGGLAGVAQFVRVGASAFVAAGAMCERDVPPFVVVQGDRARVRALNTVGLRRRGFDEPTIARLERAFRALFASKGTRARAIATLPEALRSDPRVAELVEALSVRPSR